MFERKLLMGISPFNNWDNWDGNRDGSAVAIVSSSEVYENNIALARRTSIGTGTDIVAFYSDADSTIDAVLITSSVVTPSPGTPQSPLTSLSGGICSMAAHRVADDKWIVVWRGITNDDFMIAVVSYSGGTFSAGTPVPIHASTAHDRATAQICDWGSGYWAVAFNSAGTYDQGIALVSVSGTVPTVHQVTNLDTATLQAGISVDQYSETEVVVYSSSANDARLHFVTRTGATFSETSDFQGYAGTSQTGTDGKFVAVRQETSDIFYGGHWNTSTSNNMTTWRATWSGSAFTRYDGITHSTTNDLYDYNMVIHLKNDNFLVVSNNTSTGGDLKIWLFRVSHSESEALLRISSTKYSQCEALDIEKIDDGRVMVAWKRTDNDNFECAILAA